MIDRNVRERGTGCMDGLNEVRSWTYLLNASSRTGSYSSLSSVLSFMR